MERKAFVCIKCGGRHYETDQFQATGGNFAKFFDVQNKKFVTVTCCTCCIKAAEGIHSLCRSILKTACKAV